MNNFGSTLGQYRRRWTNIDATLSRSNTQSHCYQNHYAFNIFCCQVFPFFHAELECFTTDIADKRNKNYKGDLQFHMAGDMFLVFSALSSENLVKQANCRIQCALV